MFGQFGCMPLWQTTCQGLRTIHGGGGACCSLNNKCCEGVCPVFPWNPCRPNPCGTAAICCKPCKFLPPLQPTPPGFATTLNGLKLPKRRKRRKKGSGGKNGDVKLEYRRGADYRLPPRPPCPGKGRAHLGHANLGGLCPTHFAQFRGMMGRGMMGRGMMGSYGSGFGMGPFGEAMGRSMYGSGMAGMMGAGMGGMMGAGMGGMMGAGMGGMMGRGMGPWMGQGPGGMMGRDLEAMGPGGICKPGTPGWKGRQSGLERSKSMTRVSKTDIPGMRHSRTDIGRRGSKGRLDASPSKVGLGRPSRTALGARPTMTPGRSMSPGLTSSKSMLRPSGAARPSTMFPPRPSASRSMAYPRDSRFGSMVGRPTTGGFPAGSFSGQSFMGGRPTVPRASSIFGSTMFQQTPVTPPIPPVAPTGTRISFLDKEKGSSDESGAEKPSDEDKIGLSVTEGPPWMWPPHAPDPTCVWPCSQVPPAMAGAPAMPSAAAMPCGPAMPSAPAMPCGPAMPSAPAMPCGPAMPSAPAMPCGPAMPSAPGPWAGAPAPWAGKPAPWAGVARGGFPPCSAAAPCVRRLPCSFGGRRQRSHSAVEPRPICSSICALCPCARHHVSKAVSAIVALSLIAANHATGGLCSCPTHTLPPGVATQCHPSAHPMYPPPTAVGGQGIYAGVNALRLTRSEVAVRCRM